MKTVQTLLLSLTLIAAFATSSYADKKKKKQSVEQTSKIDEPDPAIHPLSPVVPMKRTGEVAFVMRRSHYPNNRRGIDVSHHNGRIDWKTVAKTDHASYVYIKGTENSGFVDYTYKTNIREAHAAGIPVGTYHYFKPMTSFSIQLLNLWNTMPDLSDQDIIPMVDVEERGRWPHKEFIENLRQFIKGVEEHYGVKPLIYTGQHFYNEYLCGFFDDYLFMIARYNDIPPTLVGNPRFAMWQYSERGHVDGIRGYVDLSCFMDNYDMGDILIKKK